MIDKIFGYFFKMCLLICCCLFGMYLSSGTRANRKAVDYYTAHTYLIMHQLIDEGCTGFEKDIVK